MNMGIDPAGGDNFSFGGNHFRRGTDGDGDVGLDVGVTGFADGAMLPAVQTLLLKYSSDSVTGRIFGYNQSFMYLGNVAGPLIGASVSAMAGFRWVFIATAIIVFINLWQLAWMLRQTRRANA
ncbi:hypothetical protein GCM10009839_94470 [Catenulispora yoronensis]|uniref:Major facilitator superfamily (MFS) profile domain-containing protein n=1 Tax=Catenulispora yoronensis TaxID=450799 RepID=A0ABP5H9B1_9ACTN